jgi:hypothetical protein
VGFVVDKVVLGQVSPSTYVSLVNLYATKFSIIIITRGRYNSPISGRRADWAQLNFTPPHYSNKEENSPDKQNKLVNIQQYLKKETEVALAVYTDMMNHIE